MAPGEVLTPYDISPPLESPCPVTSEDLKDFQVQVLMLSHEKKRMYLRATASSGFVTYRIYPAVDQLEKYPPEDWHALTLALSRYNEIPEG